VQVRGTQDQATCLPSNTPMAVRCCADYCNKNKIPAGKGGDGGGGDNHHGGGNQHKKRCAGGKPCNKGHALPPTLPPPAKAMGGQPYGTDPNTAAGPIPPGAKNVLMIVIDDWRTEIKSLYGRSYIHTPNIDKFMQTSVGFTKAYVQQAICGATRASFLTGRRPETTRIYDLHHYWREVAGDFVSIPQHFAENGYVTRGFGKLMHPVCGAQIEQPGECDPKAWTLPYFHSKTEKHWTCNSRTVKQKNHASKGCFYAQNSYKTVMPSEEAQYPLSDTMSAKTAAAQLQSFRTAGEARPFFLGVGYHKPHLPFTVPKRHVDKYPLSSIPAARNPFAPWDLPEVAWSAYGELRNYPDIQTVDNENTQRGWGGYGGVGSKNGKQNPYPNASFPANTARALRQHYFAAVTFADENVGIVLDKLHTTGYDKNTIVILFGDHGWQLGEHSEWCKVSAGHPSSWSASHFSPPTQPPT
jgi:iduronate 2-sulfatase